MSFTYPVPENELKRLEALRKYRILDTAPESEYDHITSLASFLTGCPIAYISFIDEQRQWMKSKKGLSLCETDRDTSFCTYTILEDEVMVVEDALQHPVFKKSSLVKGEPFLRFYAGAPIRDEQGYGLGSVCVVDTEPRELSNDLKRGLHELSSVTMKLIKTRNVLDELVAVQRELKVLQGMLPICASCKYIRNDDGEWKQLESYISEYSEAHFTHGICPDCQEKLYPGI
ncbi:GAF domain-containing protein [Kiritimatiellaeota bacterium B1221]|nr:GAF domain-containing protein [Kiritimatiellaeota bacterium B1221]